MIKKILLSTLLINLANIGYSQIDPSTLTAAQHIEFENLLNERKSFYLYKTIDDFFTNHRTILGKLVERGDDFIIYEDFFTHEQKKLKKWQNNLPGCFAVSASVGSKEIQFEPMSWGKFVGGVKQVYAVLDNSIFILDYDKDGYVNNYKGLTVEGEKLHFYYVKNNVLYKNPEDALKDYPDLLAKYQDAKSKDKEWKNDWVSSANFKKEMDFFREYVKRMGY